MVGALQVMESLASDPADVQLVVQFSAAQTVDSVDLDALEDEAAVVEAAATADAVQSETVIVFFNKESFVQLSVTNDVTIRWALGAVASLLGVDSAEYALFETGGGSERLLDESTRLASILQTWKLSSHSKSRALSFKRKTSSVRESIRMGLSTHSLDLSSISMLPRGQDADEEPQLSSRGAGGAFPSPSTNAKRKKTFSRLRTNSNDSLQLQNSLSLSGGSNGKSDDSAVPALVAKNKRLESVRGELAEEASLKATPSGETEPDLPPLVALPPKKSPRSEESKSPKNSPRSHEEPEISAPILTAGSTAATNRASRPGPRPDAPPRRIKGEFGSLRDRKSKNALAGLHVQSVASNKTTSALDAALEDLHRADDDEDSTSAARAPTGPASSSSSDSAPRLEDSTESNDASLEESTESSSLSRSSSLPGVPSKPPTWLLSETDVPRYGGVATTCFSALFGFNIDKISSSVTDLATETKKQLAQLKYFEEHGPPLSAALQAQLKAVVARIREVPSACTEVPEAQQEAVLEDCRSLCGAVCAFLELLSYATDSSIEEQTNARVQYIATLLAKVLQLLLAEQYEDLPEIGAKILAGSVRVALLLRIRSHLAFTDDRVRLLRRVALQLKQSAYSLAGVIKKAATSQSLEDVDTIKQEVRAVATLLQQVPAIAKSEASSTSESALLLPDKSVLMTRLYKAIKELFASLGSASDQLPALQGSLQSILEAVKKVNEGGVMPSVPKFLKGVVDFSAAVASVAITIVASADKSQQDTREKADSFENAMLLERVQLIMLANMAAVTNGTGDAEKMDLLLHYVGSILQLLADNFKKTQPSPQL